MNAVEAEASDRAVDGRSSAPIPSIHIATAPAAPVEAADTVRETAIELVDVSCYYGSFRAVKEVSVIAAKRQVTALIGPSGCGKTTLLRTFNRMNDLVPSFRATTAPLG